jgi:hypothetical protein
MMKKPLFLGAGLAASLVLYTNCLLAQDAGSGSSGGTPPPPASGNTTTKSAPRVDLSKLPPDSDKKNLTFATDIGPMLKASCSNCHGDTKPKSGYSVLTATSVLKDAKGRAIIVPGKSSKSIIVLYVSGAYTNKEKVMPPLNARDNNPPLTKEQIGILRAWIDQGASK